MRLIAKLCRHELRRTHLIACVCVCDVAIEMGDRPNSANLVFGTSPNWTLGTTFPPTPNTPFGFAGKKSDLATMPNT